jgi:streptogramin lyase
MWFTDVGDVIGVMNMSGTVIATYQIPTAGSGAGLIVVGPDGNLWFTEGGLPSNCVFNMAKISMAGAIKEYPIPTQQCNLPWGAFGGLTVGPDNNIWFTERLAAKVGMITTAGVITEYPMPANPVTEGLNRIIRTPDGAMWFLHNMLQAPWTAQIGKLDTTGTVTDLWSFPVAHLTGMTAGPDGNPWALDSENAMVIRL